VKSDRGLSARVPVISIVLMSRSLSHRGYLKLGGSRADQRGGGHGTDDLPCLILEFEHGHRCAQDDGPIPPGTAVIPAWPWLIYRDRYTPRLAFIGERWTGAVGLRHPHPLIPCSDSEPENLVSLCYLCRTSGKADQEGCQTLDAQLFDRLGLELVGVCLVKP